MFYRRFLLPVSVAGILLGSLARGEDSDRPGFTPAGEGLFRFDTGTVRGLLRMTGRNQGIVSLVDVESGTELIHSVGALSYYRIFSSGRRYGNAARDWPTRSRLLPDGAVEVHFEPEDAYPFQLAAIYRWSTPDTLDVETIVEAGEPLPKFEVFLSSYFSPQMRCYVYGAPNYFEKAQPQLIAVDVNPLIDGTYLAFPRDRQAILMMFDGRWDLPPHPVQWSVTRRLAGPLAVRRDEENNLSVAVMAPPSDCFAVSTPYNKTPPDGPAAHASIYLSLFGKDIAANETVRARSRIAVGRNRTDQQIIDAYLAYIDTPARADQTRNN